MDAATAEAYLEQFQGAMAVDEEIDMILFEETIAAVSSSNRNVSTGQDQHNRRQSSAGTSASFYDAVAAQNVRMVCDDYVNKFMKDSTCITDLRESLHACQFTLGHMETVLETFVSALFNLQAEMCELKTRAMKSTLVLDHAKSVQTVVQNVISHLLVPPDVIQVIVGTGSEELGPQFQCSLRKLHKLLRNRNGKWKADRGAANRQQQQQQHRKSSSNMNERRSSAAPSQTDMTQGDHSSSSGAINRGGVDNSRRAVLEKLATLLSSRLPVSPDDTDTCLDAYVTLQKELQSAAAGAARSQQLNQGPMGDLVAAFLVASVPDWTAEVRVEGEEASAVSDAGVALFYDWMCERGPEGFGGDPRDVVFSAPAASSASNEAYYESSETSGLTFPITVSKLLTAYDLMCGQHAHEGSSQSSSTLAKRVAVGCGCQLQHLLEWRDSYGERQRKCTQRLLDWLNDVRYHAFRPRGGAGILWTDAVERQPSVIAQFLDWIRENNVSLADIRRTQVQWAQLVHEWFAHKGNRHRISAGAPFARWLNTILSPISAELTAAREAQLRQQAQLHSQQQNRASLSASPSNDSISSNATFAPSEGGVQHHQHATSHRSVEIALRDCKAFREVHRIMDDLTVFACEKIRSFLTEKISSVLKRQRTNISVQQEHVLRPYAPLVHFLRHCAPYLRHRMGDDAASSQGRSGATTPSDPNATTLHQNLPFRIVRALYAELRLHYINIVSSIYFNKICSYVTNCNALEVAYSATGTVGGGGKGPSKSASSTWTFFAGRSAAAPNFELPLLTDPSGRVGPADFGIGQRGDIFSTMFSIPVIPHVHAAKGQKHGYGETFRSINLLLCDAVTSEYLFTVDFFAGDISVYADAFQPTVQLIVDYVSEVLLQNHHTTAGTTAAQHRRAAASVFASCNRDVCGLLSLIRQCHIFRFMMTRVRRLTCLDGYYDSILMLLWPAFKEAFEIQLAAMKSITDKQIVSFLADVGGSSLEEKFAAVHPITLRYAEFSAALMAMGTLNEASSHSVAPSTPSGGLPQSPSSDLLFEDSGSGSLSFDQCLVLGGAAQRRVRSIVAENDRAESLSRFAVLQSNLAFLRVEFLRIVNVSMRELCKQAASGENNRHHIGHKVSAAFQLNNVYHVHAVWSGTKLLPTGLTSEQLSSAFSPHAHHRHHQDQANGEEESKDKDTDEPQHSTASFNTSPTSPAETQRDDPSGDGGRERRGLADSPDFVALTDVLLTARTAFVEQALRLVFPDLVILMCDELDEDHAHRQVDGSSVGVTSAVDVAEKFSSTWRDGVTSLHRDVILRFVSHPSCQRDCLVAASSQLLLYNTRLQHKVLASPQGGMSPAETVSACLVPHQVLLHHIRAVFRV